MDGVSNAEHSEVNPGGANTTINSVIEVADGDAKSLLRNAGYGSTTHPNAIANLKVAQPLATAISAV